MTRATMLRGACLGVVFLGLVAGEGRSEMRNRTRGHGVVEFTNQDRPGARAKARQAARDGEGAPAPVLARGEKLVAPGGTFWARERPGGIVEFTNLRPSGKNWKVWLKAGPGKASALRGRTDVVPPRDRAPARFSRYDKDIHDQQAFYGIPEALIRAVIKTESDFDPNVVSSAGAQGLMQLMPETARLMGVTSTFDGRQNIMGGARYLQILARRFCRTPVAADDGAQAGGPVLICSDDEKVKVIAAYHAGPAAVLKYGGMPPYETTRAYVTTVLRRFDEYRRAAATAAPAVLTER